MWNEDSVPITTSPSLTSHGISSQNEGGVMLRRKPPYHDPQYLSILTAGIDVDGKADDHSMDNDQSDDV